MDKVERLISIVMILLRKDIVSTTDFAELFNVSKRTILRDMEALSLSNIPIYSVSGVNGGYGIMDEYKMDKRLLSSSDLENILTALNGLEKILVSQDVETTIKKIEAMVSPLSLKSPIQLSFYDWEGRAEIVELLRTCQQSISKRKMVSFEYMDKDGASTSRTVEPYQLHFSETSWYLKGFCLDRMSYRTFKLSRINRLAMDERTFAPREFSVEQEREATYQPQLAEIKALITPSIKDQFIERYGRKCLESYNSEYLLATFQVPHNSTGFRFLAGFGTNIKIVAPESYVEDFRDYINAIMENYISGGE